MARSLNQGSAELNNNLPMEEQMNKHLWKPTLGLILVGGLLLGLAAACTGGVSQQDYDAVQGELKALQTQVAQAAVVAPHPALAAHPYKPKRLVTVGTVNVIEIDMREFSYDSPDGAKNPTFRLPAGKEVGIHVHNEGAITHELAIGRKRDTTTGEYAELLTEMVPMVLFAYNGSSKARAEVEGAVFGELEIDAGIRDFWLRFTVPAELKGEWEIGCLIKEADGKDHYAEGMHAKLIFE